MIRCIQIGGKNGPITQGEYKVGLVHPVRRPPLFELEQEHLATVEACGRDYTGVLIPSIRNGETVQ